MLGSKVFNENDHLSRTKNEKKETLTPRRPFNVITNHKTPSSAKKPLAVPKSAPISITIFEDEALEKVEEKQIIEQNSFNEICAEFENKNGPMEAWDEYPEVERFSTAPPPSPFYEHEIDNEVRILAELKNSDLNTSFDELCAQLYRAPVPWSDDETPPVEVFPQITVDMSDYQIPRMEEESDLVKDDDVYFCSEILDDSFDSDMFDENSYYIELEKEKLDLIY